jgi:hypothetical protein
VIFFGVCWIKDRTEREKNSDIHIHYAGAGTIGPDPVFSLRLSPVEIVTRMASGLNRKAGGESETLGVVESPLVLPIRFPETETMMSHR